MTDYRGRFVWYELMTTDMAAARTFYAKVVGWGVQDASMPGLAYTFFTAGNAFVSGLMGMPDEARNTGAMPRWIGYVAVDDVDAAVDRISRLGGAVHVPPTDLLNTCRFAIIADPQTASLALIKWLRPRSEPLAGPSESGRVGWHELLTADCEKALDFYGRIFDWRKAETGAGPAGPYHLFAVGGQTIGGVYAKPSLVPVPLWLYYFNVRDINAAAKRVKACGGEVIEGPVEVRDGDWMARCIDPQGAMFALGGRLHHDVGYFAPAVSRASKPKL